MRLYAYYDRFDCERFGVLRNDGLVTGRQLDQIGKYRESTHMGIGWAVRFGGRSLRKLEKALARVEAAGTHPRPLGDRRPAVAIADPEKIVCVGLNYRSHVSEGAGRDVPDRPLLFSKFANAVVADGEPIVRPEGCHALDLEVELGVVIGKTARRVAKDQAMDHVAGYVVVNDVSARDWQGSPPALREGEKGDGQWLRAKGSDTFLPMGPVFVTKDELDPAAGLRLRSWRIPAGGEPTLMQDGTTADMIFGVPELVAFITRHITLEPGDVIATGTPAGVGVFRDPPVFLEPGDRVRCEIEGIGSVENPIVDWTDDPRDR
jgi:2-keto-4-pentenoate hydratase/2-oxohepta-3-ene-1,7-dioic acid hydratase in catechol pathway